MSHASKQHLAHSRPSANVCSVMVCSVMGVLRRGCVCDPGSWHPAKTGGICACHVGAKSTGSLFQDREKVFCQSESIPASNYFWVIVCVVRAGCGIGCGSQAVHEGGIE